MHDKFEEKAYYEVGDLTFHSTEDASALIFYSITCNPW